ncbi:hypothetical protein K4T03_03640 [Staphylococcus epidermidis]|nr:hypothetical protein [Staphylococcus epidermidis]
MVYKYFCEEIYNTSPILNFLTGLYTAFITMLNLSIPFLKTNNEDLQQEIPKIISKWNSDLFAGFIFLVLTAITLTYLKSKQDIADKKKESENKKYILKTLKYKKNQKNSKTLFYYEELHNKY